jgi:hypothetical protein
MLILADVDFGLELISAQPQRSTSPSTSVLEPYEVIHQPSNPPGYVSLSRPTLKEPTRQSVREPFPTPNKSHAQLQNYSLPPGPYNQDTSLPHPAEHLSSEGPYMSDISQNLSTWRKRNFNPPHTGLMQEGGAPMRRFPKALSELDRGCILPVGLEPQVRAQLLKVPEQQFRMIMAQYEKNKEQAERRKDTAASLKPLTTSTSDFTPTSGSPTYYSLDSTQPEPVSHGDYGTFHSNPSSSTHFDFLSSNGVSSGYVNSPFAIANNMSPWSRRKLCPTDDQPNPTRTPFIPVAPNLMINPYYDPRFGSNENDQRTITPEDPARISSQHEDGAPIFSATSTHTHGSGTHDRLAGNLDPVTSQNEDLLSYQTEDNESSNIDWISPYGGRAPPAPQQGFAFKPRDVREQVRATNERYLEALNRDEHARGARDTSRETNVRDEYSGDSIDGERLAGTGPLPRSNWDYYGPKGDESEFVRANAVTEAEGDEVEFVRASPITETEAQRRRDQEEARVFSLLGETWAF